MHVNNAALKRLRLRDFRNYRGADLAPSTGLNLIVGPNAQGKTNLLEAVHLVSTGRLLRGTRDVQGVREGAEEAEVSGTLANLGTEITVCLREGKRRKVSLNGLGLPRASDMLGRLPSVCFAAGDLEIARGEPADRRQFLDTELAQMYSSYLRHLTQYKKSLEQRNAMLRSASERPISPVYFESYEEQLAVHGSAIREHRRIWLDTLGELAARWHAKLGGGESLELTYMPKDVAENESALRDMLESTRRDDIARGVTTVGPHRDEVLITVAGKEARVYGSQGQQRTAVIAIKLATMECVQSTFGYAPLLLLDDVFSDLDESRRAELIGAGLERGGQVFLTCTEIGQAGSALVGVGKVFSVRSGEVISE
jgi:DNA replication and repair protein RecF